MEIWMPHRQRNVWKSNLLPLRLIHTHRVISIVNIQGGKLALCGRLWGGTSTPTPPSPKKKRTHFMGEQSLLQTLKK